MRYPRPPRRGCSLAMSLAALALTTLVVIGIIIVAQSPQPMPAADPVIPSPPPAAGDRFTDEERSHLGLLNRIAAAELLAISVLPLDEQTANSDYRQRVTAAYRWSDKEAGDDAIFGATRDNPRLRPKVLLKELPIPSLPSEVPPPIKFPSIKPQGIFSPEPKAEIDESDDLSSLDPHGSWDCSKCRLPVALTSPLLPDEIRTCQCPRCTDWSWVEIGHDGLIQANMIGG